MIKIKCYSVDDDDSRHEVDCIGGGFIACRNCKNGVFFIPYSYSKVFLERAYCHIIHQNTIWVKYDFECIMREAIKKHGGNNE